MSELAQDIIVGVIAVGTLYTIVQLIRAKRAEDKNLSPPITPKPFEVDGIWLGKYYGNPETRQCATVINVENGIVAFKLESPVNRITEKSMPIETFLTRFHRYPNGCSFDGPNP